MAHRQGTRSETNQQRLAAVQNEAHEYTNQPQPLRKTGDDQEPTSFREAMNSEESSQWWAAMKTEIEALVHRKGTWSLVERTDDMNVIRAKWVYKLKRRNHARLEV
eukprot:CAMPEP_0119200452 /NCGR_PEP_ID=MMETSP1316-20130426/26038_1 /TAXON_ID=41880 /ORGANISM="Pycnococcus provasolii, Strain RCC2336" /LENGTH=105 /DNA_ID=CAMNT_0007196507 /DNA_START=833 /DNA_END=1150 /DNA_ORIENTATION=+